MSLTERHHAVAAAAGHNTHAHSHSPARPAPPAAPDIDTPREKYATVPLIRRSPYTSSSRANRIPFNVIVEAIQLRPWIGGILGILTGLILYTITFYLHSGDTYAHRTAEFMTLSRARHDFAFTALFGENLHERYAYPIRLDDDNDAEETFTKSASMRLTHSSRRAIAVAYHKTGKSLLSHATSSSSISPLPHPPRLLHQWSSLMDGGVEANIDLDHLEGLELRRDYERFPSPLPVFISLPSSVGSDGISPASREQILAAETQERVLCFYVFAASDEEYLKNLEHFIQHVVRGRDQKHIDYVFLINQLENKLLDLSTLPKLPRNAKYIQHRNECYDWGTIGWILDIQDELLETQRTIPDDKKSPYWLNLEKYKYFIIMNSSVRGPWFPSYIDLNDPRNIWYAPLKHMLDLSPGSHKMAGPVVSCQVQPHLQSYILMTDREGLQILRTHTPDEKKPVYQERPAVRVTDYNDLGRLREAARKNSRVQGEVGQCLDEPTSTTSLADLAGSGVFGCHTALQQAVLEAELGASKQMLEQGFNLVCLTRMYAHVDFRVHSYQRCFEALSNPSDLALGGNLVRHGPFSREGVRKRDAEEARVAELIQKQQQEREYKDILSRAASLTEKQEGGGGSSLPPAMSAIGQAIGSLMQAIPEGAGDAGTEAQQIIPELEKGAEAAAKRALLAVTPWPVDQPQPISFEQLSTRNEAHATEPLYIDPLEVLFGKYKSYKLFPPKHIQTYFHSLYSTQRREIYRYIIDYVRPMKDMWEFPWNQSHKYRVQSRLDAAADQDREAQASSSLRLRKHDPLHWMQFEPRDEIAEAKKARERELAAEEEKKRLEQERREREQLVQSQSQGGDGMGLPLQPPLGMFPFHIPGHMGMAGAGGIGGGMGGNPFLLSQEFNQPAAAVAAPVVEPSPPPPQKKEPKPKLKSGKLVEGTSTKATRPKSSAASISRAKAELAKARAKEAADAADAAAALLEQLEREAQEEEDRLLESQQNEKRSKDAAVAKTRSRGKVKLQPRSIKKEDPSPAAGSSSHDKQGANWIADKAKTEHARRAESVRRKQEEKRLREEKIKYERGDRKRKVEPTVQLTPEEIRVREEKIFEQQSKKEAMNQAP